MVVYILSRDDSNIEIQAIKEAMRKNKSLRMHKRYMVILRHLQGYLNKQIADIELLSEQTVGTYVKNYKKYGLEGFINNTPDEVGFTARKNWTIELIRQWVIKSFHVTFSHRGMADALHRLNLSYTRPTYVLKKADPIKQESFKKDFEVLKKTP